MITTVTANPAVDYTVKVKELNLNKVNRGKMQGEIAAGKGINVSKAVNKLGKTTQVLGCVGGKTGEFIERSLREQGIETDLNWTDKKTRRNINLVDNEDNETKINLAGEVPWTVGEKLKEKVLNVAVNSDVIVLSGSLPQQFPPKFYYDLIEELSNFSGQIFLDTSGKPLQLALPAGPDLIKPNQEELEELCGRNLSLTGVVKVSQELVDQGIDLVLVSRGKEGAVLTTKEGSWQAVPPQVKPVSTVGAGDSLVAGMSVGNLKHDSIKEIFRFAVAESIATILRPGAEMGTYKEAEEWKRKIEIKESEE